MYLLILIRSLNFSSGIVEPIAGVIGAALVTFITPILPYALAFAAGAMVYVVVDDIVPEAQVCCRILMLLFYQYKKKVYKMAAIFLPQGLNIRSSVIDSVLMYVVILIGQQSMIY